MVSSIGNDEDRAEVHLGVESPFAIRLAFLRGECIATRNILTAVVHRVDKPDKKGFWLTKGGGITMIEGEP